MKKQIPLLMIIVIGIAIGITLLFLLINNEDDSYLYFEGENSDWSASLDVRYDESYSDSSSVVVSQGFRHNFVLEYKGDIDNLSHICSFNISYRVSGNSFDSYSGSSQSPPPKRITQSSSGTGDPLKEDDEIIVRIVLDEEVIEFSLKVI